MAKDNYSLEEVKRLLENDRKKRGSRPAKEQKEEAELIKKAVQNAMISGAGLYGAYKDVKKQIREKKGRTYAGEFLRSAGLGNIGQLIDVLYGKPVEQEKPSKVKPAAVLTKKVGKIGETLASIHKDVRYIRERLEPKKIVAKSGERKQFVQYDPLAPEGEKFRQVSEKGKLTTLKVGKEFEMSAKMQAAMITKELDKNEEKKKSRFIDPEEKRAFDQGGDLAAALAADDSPLAKLKESMEDNFTKVFKELAELKQIAKSSGGGGGLMDDALDLLSTRGRRRGRRRGRMGKLLKGAARLGKGALRFARFAGPVGAAVSVGLGAYDAVKGFSADKNATLGQKFLNAGSSALSGATFGLLGKSPEEIAAASTPAAAPAPAPSSGPQFRLGPAAARRGKIEPSAGRNAAIAAADSAGITGAHKAQFLAQLEHESGGFKRVEENLRYSAKRLMQIFPKYYKSEEDARKDENQPQAIANRVYANRMGNGPPESGDGYKYRGRGLIQLTGKSNYKKFGDIIGMDLVSNPDAAANLGTAAQLAAAYYKKQVVDRGIAADDTKSVTRAINGGSIGLSEREALFASNLKDPSMMTAAAAPTASQSEPTPTAGQETQIGTPVGGAAAPVMAAAQASAPVPSAAPSAVTPARTTNGAALEAGSRAVQVASATAPAPSVVVAPTPARAAPAGKMAAKPADLPAASVRMNENSFVRALARDFVHPSVFTSTTPV